MQRFYSFVRDTQWFTVVVGAIAGVFCVAMIANASSTISTNISTDGTLSVTGASTLSSTLGVSGLSTLAGFISTASSSVSSTLGVSGLATLSSGAVIGSSGSTVTQILFGTCQVDLPSMTASTTGVADCTAAGVSTSDKVFVTPASTTAQIIPTGASSTGSNTIQVAAYNIGSPSGTVNPAAVVWSWMAVR